jgi:uncharacterized repeat protein (TIGR01451 family)
MKPFGVRLAAGAVTILLGAIMAAQAQKDHQDELHTSWNPLNHVTEQTDGAPAPIGLGQWAGTNADTPIEASEPSPFADIAGAVQLVQHTEESVTDKAKAVANDVGDAVSNALAMPSTFSTPSGSASAAPAVKMTFPGEAPESNSEVAAALNLPPTLGSVPTETQPAAQPSNLLRGAAEETAGADTAMPNQFMSGLPQREAGPADMQATQMLRSVTAPSEPHPGQQQAALEQQRREIAAEEQRREELAFEQQAREQQAREQQAREIELERQRRADAMLAEEQFQREQLAREAELQLQQEQQRRRDEAPAMNHFAADANFAQPMPTRGVSMTGYGEQARPHAPTLPRGQYGDQYNEPARNQSTQNGFGSAGLQALPVGHRTNAGTTASLAQPGDRRLEGAQAPSVVIHKRAPGEVKVGKAAEFVIHVQNVGSAEALNVRVFDHVPSGMRFKDATPQPQSDGKGQLVWQLGALAAGEERTVTMDLIPVEEGELGSVARVTFEAAASVRTMSTRPELKIVQNAPKSVLVGQQLEIEVKVSNPGTGDATGVMMQEDVPENLEHPRGRELDNLVGTLRPGEVRTQMLRLRAVSPGMVRNTIFLRGDDGLETQHSVDVQVVSPQLQVALVGPGRRFLERQATYNLDIANSGTAPATNVRITAFLDRGFTFVSTGKAGQYDPSRHAVYWQLEDLPVGSRGQVPLTLLPVQEGARSIQLEAKADLGILAKNEHNVDVESLAELTFSVADSADPIEVGTDTVYEIKVANHGSRPDSNVKVQVQLPPGIELLDAEDAQSNGRGLVVFRPRASLAANSELVYRIKARGVRDGRHKIEAIVMSDQSTVPVTKEESTMVYDDRQPAVARGRNSNVPQGQQFRQQFR